MVTPVFWRTNRIVLFLGDQPVRILPPMRDGFEITRRMVEDMSGLGRHPDKSAALLLPMVIVLLQMIG